MPASSPTFELSSIILPQAVGLLLLGGVGVLQRMPLSLYAIWSSSKYQKESAKEGILGFLLLCAGFALLSPIWHVRSMSPDQIFNLFEGYLWLGIAIAFHIVRSKHPTFKAENRVATISFFLFGISDFIEMHTGAWYRPWQLFILKSACMIGFIISLSWYVATKRLLQNKNT